MYWATPATTARPAARGAANPVGSAPEAEEADATADEAEPLTLEMTLAWLEGPSEAAEDDALATALEAAEVIELMTDEIDDAVEADAEAEDAAEDCEEATEDC